MYYLNGKGEKVVVSNEYYVDILPELEEAGRTAIGEFRPGWFPRKAELSGGNRLPTGNGSGKLRRQQACVPPLHLLFRGAGSDAFHTGSGGDGLVRRMR